MGTQHIRIADNCRQRRFQFMGKSAHKLFPGLNFFLQPFNVFLQRFGHFIKIPRQLSQFIPADLFRPIGIVSRRHPLGRPRQQPHRFGHKRRNKMHDQHGNHQHHKHHLTVQGKTHSTLRKHFRNILHHFQIEYTVQCIDRNRGMYKISASVFNDTVGLHVFSGLRKQPVVRRKPFARIQHLFLLIGNPQKTARSPSSRFQVRGDLLHSAVRQHSIFGRHTESRRLKRKAQDTALILRLSHLARQ